MCPVCVSVSFTPGVSNLKDVTPDPTFFPFFFFRLTFGRPLNCQNGENTNFEVSIDESRMHEEDGILTNDVRGVIRPALKDLKVAIVRRTQELRQASSYVLSFVFLVRPVLFYLL